MERGHRVRDGARTGAKFRDQFECISSFGVDVQRKRRDEKNEQEHKLQDEKVKRKRQETKVTERKGVC